MIRISDNLAISKDEIEEHFIRSSGPGGQHVNTTSTGVQLRFDAANSPSLPDDVRKRLMRLAGHRLTHEGVLIIEAKKKRSQAANREDALERLIELIQDAEKAPRTRRKTRPSSRAKAKRMDDKHRRSDVKRNRAPIRGTDD